MRPAGSSTHDGSNDTQEHRILLMAIAVHPDGCHIVVGGSRAIDRHKQRSLLDVVDLETRQWVAEETSSSSEYTSIALVPGNGGKQLVATADGGKHMEVWELDMGCAKPKLKCT